jgi:hypothetical protein
MGNRHRIRTAGAAAVLVVATLVVLGGRADAATGPTFVGGQSVASFDGSDGSSVSFNGSKTLVVWVSPGRDIYGRIMAPDTTSIGSPFRISTATNKNEASPSVAWDGTSWLVAWEASSSTSATRPDIRGRRVSSSGGLLGTELAIATATDSQTGPTVAAGANGQFLVVWEDARNVDTTDNDVYGQRITKTGALLDGTGGRRLSNDSTSFPADETSPDVAWNGSTYLIVWRQQDADESISGKAIRPNGDPAFTGDIVYSVQSGVAFYSPAIASDGKGFLIVFNDYFPGSETGSDLLGAILTDYDEGATIVPVAQTSGQEQEPAVTFNGTYLVAWEDERDGGDIFATRLRPNGTRLDGDGVALTGPQTFDYSVSLAPGSDPNQFAYSWTVASSDHLTSIGALGVQFAPK